MTQPRTPIPSGDSGFHHHPSNSLPHDSSRDAYRRSSLAHDIPMQDDVIVQPGPSKSGAVEYSIPFADDLQPDANNLPRRRFSNHDGQSQQSTFPADPRTTFDQSHPGPFDQPLRSSFDSDPRSFDRSSESYISASSPYASRLDSGSSGGQVSSASSPYASTGTVPSSIPTPNFGQHTSPPTFGHQLHASPTYTPSPLTNPSSHSFYVGNGFEAPFDNGGMPLPGLGMDDNNNTASNMISTVDSPLYEKSHQIMYDVKPPDHDHRLGNGSLQQPFQVEQGHVSSQNHVISGMAPSQPWPQENESRSSQGGEYWGAGDFKYYQ